MVAACARVNHCCADCPRAAGKHAAVPPRRAAPRMACFTIASRVRQPRELFKGEIACLLLPTPPPPLRAHARFADFTGDAVVAPVRLAVAQVLALACMQLPQGGVRRVLGHLLALVDHDVWHTRHGAVLGLQYLLAACAKVQWASGACVLPACCVLCVVCRCACDIVPALACARACVRVCPVSARRGVARSAAAGGPTQHWPP